MEQTKSNTRVAGVDVGKAYLDMAVHGLEDAVRIANTASGFEEGIGWLKARQVVRIGLEASGGYERGLRAALEAAGLEVVVHQPLEVRLFARLKRLKAKLEQVLSDIGWPAMLIERSLYLGKDIPLSGTAHQAGTCRFGTDPSTSVLNLDCRAHELDNLYLADASFFPSIGAVNPTLTIIANALRVADRIRERL